MVLISADNQDIETCLYKLCRQVTDIGGRIDDEADLFCDQGYLGVRSRRARASNEPLVMLPESGLIPMDKVKIRLSGNHLELADHHSDMGPQRVALFETMLELYNLTRKIEDHQRSCIWAALADEPRLMQQFLGSQATIMPLKEFYDCYQANERERLIIRTFFEARMLAFKAKNCADRDFMLMPIIDCFNHHINAPPYINKKNDDGRLCLSVLDSCRDADTGESYVRYGLFDASDLLVHFGFVPNATPFVRSIPLSLKFDHTKEIRIRAFARGPYPESLPEPIADLRNYAPERLEETEDHVVYSHIIVPGANAPFSMRRILSMVISQACRKQGTSDVQELVAGAEDIIVAENSKFYQGLLQALAGIAPTGKNATMLEMLKKMAALQLQHLRNYSLFHGKTGRK